MQTYGGAPSTVSLEGDRSTAADARRIRELFRFNAATLLGGHSAGSAVARRIALDHTTNVRSEPTYPSPSWTPKLVARAPPHSRLSAPMSTEVPSSDSRYFLSRSSMRFSSWRARSRLTW